MVEQHSESSRRDAVFIDYDEPVSQEGENLCCREQTHACNFVRCVRFSCSVCSDDRC